MARFINDTIRPFRNAIKSYTNSYFYTTDSIDVRFHVEGVLSDDNKSGLTNDTYRGKRYIYDGSMHGVGINMPQGIDGQSLTNGDIIEFQSNGLWQAVWSSQGITSDEYPDSDYTSIGTFVYNKETENILVFDGSLWKEIQPASSLQVTTPDFTGDNTSTLNFFGHTGSKNLVLSGDGTDGTANVELNSPFSSKYFFGPSAPNQSTTPINFGDRWYSTEIGSELVWIPNLPDAAVLFEAGTTFAKDSGGKFAADTSNISFIGQDGKSYIVPETEFNNYVSGNYDLANSESLTGVWVMIPIAGGGDGSLSEIIVDGITYPSVSSLNFGSGNNVTLDSSIDGSSLSLTFGIDISTVVGPTGPTGVDGSTGNTGVVGTISAGGNSVVDAQFLSFEDGGIITASSLTSDSGITVTYSATLVGATGIYVSGSTVGLSANVEDLSNVSSNFISGYDTSTEPPNNSSGNFWLDTQQNELYFWNIQTEQWQQVTTDYTGYYYYGSSGNLYYIYSVNGIDPSLVAFNTVAVSDPQSLVYDLSTSKYVRKPLLLDDIADVTAGSPIDGYYLQYNNTIGRWEPGAPPDLDGITGQVDIFVDGVTYSDQDIIAFTGQDGANGIPITRVKRTETFGTMGSLLEFGLSGAPHSLFPDNAFKTNTSATGHAKKVLTLNDDGTIGWEYLRNYDVVDPDKFTFGINSFSFDTIDTTVLANAPGTTHFDQDTTIIATYNGVVTETSISETSVGTFDISGFPRSVTSTDEFSVLWPNSLTGYNGTTSTLGFTNRTKITFTLSATGTFDGITANDTRNRVVVYANNIYAGYPVGSTPELITSQNDLGLSGIDEVQTFAEASWNSNIDSYNTDSNYTVSSINNKPIKDLGIGEDFLDSSVNGNTKYFYIMWPERYGFQIHQPTDNEVCEFAIFKNFTQSETSNTSFFVSGLTVANEYGFEERYVLYRLPNGDASNWKVELVPGLSCANELK